MGRFPAERGPSAAANMRIGTWTAATAIESMLMSATPDGDHELPSSPMKTPLSVAAAIVVRLNAKARTARPSRPLGTDQVAPPSPLSRAPPPRVPARTSPGLNGLNAIVVGTAVPLCTDAHADPPPVLLRGEPCELPAIRPWLLIGSTASAKMAERP